MTKTLLTAVLIAVSASATFAKKKQVAPQPQDPNEMVAYLFTYFNSNDPKDEQICYALSEDGYNYTPINDGMPVISSDTIALTQCVRDPHILRCEDGKTFYMVVTDMKSNLGWNSNRGMVLLKSTDLINWQHTAINFPTRYTKTWKNVQRVWAPETIYDRKAGKYMVFYSLASSDRGSYDKIYYQYANKDFTDLEGEPKWLFDAGCATIDGDIVYNEADQLYHLFYKQEAGRGIYQAVAKELTDKWQMIGGNVEQTKESVEGVGVCKAIDGKSWIIMYDCYGNGHYQFCKSEDLKTFQFVQNTEMRGKFTPRHGTIIPITRAEKERLLKAFPNHKQPILSGFHADPEVLYSNKTKKYYIYSTTDGTPGWGGHDFSVFSSENLVDWKDEGKMLDVKGDQVKWATGNAWAPCIIEKKVGKAYKYFFYFSAHNPKSNRKEIGVAVSDSPTGPFVDSGAPIITDADRPKEARGGQAIDVDVFQDPKTGKCYLYWGNGFMAGAELNDDMLSVKKETITHLTPKGGNLQSWAFREGAYVFYRKGTYYFMWSVDDTGSPNYHVCYGTAKSPLGPISIDENSYMVIKQKPEDQIYGTAHNSVLQIPGKDEWYIVYHRINKNFVHHEPGIHREVCIDRMTFDKQGRIIPVTPTLNGPEPLSKK
ncbi:family 43 glycosylhydrolase [uncultured Prevotella sp.]|uniref:family 43 glycosylhydrolase n=1 Tax=uncultured Prevotella sp. TaxID=159272 RepID=UPI002587CF94|nr:family 43 glycosylhydrolase [uncultured Prevotella sp.]